MVAALNSFAVDGRVLPLRRPYGPPNLVFQILKTFQVETLRQEDVQMVYRFVLMPSSSPVLTFRPVS